MFSANFSAVKLGHFAHAESGTNYIVHDEEDDGTVGQAANNPEALHDGQPAGRDDIDRSDDQRHRPLQHKPQKGDRCAACERRLSEEAASNEIQNEDGLTILISAAAPMSIVPATNPPRRMAAKLDLRIGSSAWH
jgi:hypothetical protein